MFIVPAPDQLSRCCFEEVRESRISLEIGNRVWLTCFPLAIDATIPSTDTQSHRVMFVFAFDRLCRNERDLARVDFAANIIRVACS